MSLPVIVMAKAPEAGRVKTRLIPTLGADEACALYRRLLRHTLSHAAQYTNALHLHVSPDLDHPELQALAHEFDAQLSLQCQGDLGQRMLYAFSQLGTPALLIGSDCPLLDAPHLHAAAQALEQHDITLSPSSDGGYVLIGLQQPHPAPFQDIDWSTARVLAQSQAQCQRAGLRLHLGETLWDVDDGNDYAQLQNDPRFDHLVAKCP
ncbi:TIGR04282 family arsenosugar biosynthesis glycosyltransferase [Atopomonas sediminilitoris]|uniref:TIGR04282 family arsenosugar biosynthesis glycosyltransferase n=1 Tax=Atopomonas sediminilitoris TaxID=2919919 RepID=UPI001F4DE10A|nr:TIGR04282 family arsenosugar biosynthesis glycosyltransferase [Atopomonas sediminilitoris]MCJ8169338.1 TIGR04282 family arsenosugar biosynthesis glycosyltransferase [Atopomonas sediminilitoris]